MSEFDLNEFNNFNDYENIEQVIITITCRIYALYCIFYFICLHLSEIEAYRDARNTCLGGRK